MKKIIPWLRKVALVSIFLFLALTWTGLARDYLYDWDEGIYATLGREMRETGNLLTPTWNGDLWLEKPPAIAWVTAIGMGLAGENELGSRLLMPIFSGLTLIAVFLIGERIGGTLMGAGSMAVLGYFNLFLARSRAVNVDGMLLATITWTIWLLSNTASPWLVGVVMGLAIMIKGPAGILAILIALPLLYKKPWPYLRQILISFLVVVVPWHLYSYVVHGNTFVTPYLLEQVIRRATTPIEFHTESRWFYFNFLIGDLGLGVLIVALAGAAMTARELIRGGLRRDLLTLLWWVILPLGLFTVAKTRLSWYILPIYPALALLIGMAITQLVKVQKASKVIAIIVVGMCAQMVWHAYAYVAPNRVATPLADQLIVAKELGSYKNGEVAMLVSESERIAEAILPVNQSISSSFRYGGSPSVVWYAHKPVKYYYNYDHFTKDATDNPDISFLIVTVADKSKVPPSFKLVVETKSYLGFIREANYALR